MRHKIAYRKLNRTSEHRKALFKNMLNSLIKYEQITTTLPKAKVLKPQAEKIITLGKKDTLHNTKALISKLQDIKSANKVNKTEISKLVAEKLAKKAVEKNIKKIYFDRGQFKYHGRVKIFAETLRKNGMEF